MKKFNKFLAMTLAAIMTLGMFAGCGSGDSGNSGTSGSSGGKKNELITLTVFSQLANTSGEQTGWFAKVMEDRFGVKLIIVPDGDGVYDTRMEAGNLGDIVVFGSDGSQYKNAVQAGLLLDWEDDDLLKDYGPYILENMSNALEKNRSISGTGKVYGFGHAVAATNKDHQSFMYQWDLRWDLYQQLGCPQVKTLDDYFDMLVEMKKLCPTDDNGNETYAYYLWPDWDGNMVMYVKSMVSAYYGYDEFNIGNLDPATGKFYDCLDPDGPYIEMLKYFNKCYRAGLLAPDSMTCTFTEMSEKMTAGGVFCSIFDYAITGFNSDEHYAQNKIMLPVAPEDANPIVYGLSTLGGNRIWSIGAKTEYPELCMEIINWLATPEGRMVSEYGPQGLIWDYDENGKTYFTEYGNLVRGDSTIDMSAGSDYSGTWNDGRQAINNITWAIDAKNPDSNGETFNSAEWASNQAEPKNQAETDWRTWAGCNSITQYMENRGKYVVAPEVTYSDATRSDELELTWNNVIKCIKDYTWKAMYAKNDGEFNFLVNTMIKDADRYGYQDCVKFSEEQAAIKYALMEAERE